MVDSINYKEIRNDVCGSHGCIKEVSTRLSFPIVGFSAGFCSECAGNLAKDNIGIKNVTEVTH